MAVPPRRLPGPNGPDSYDGSETPVDFAETAARADEMLSTSPKPMRPGAKPVFDESNNAVIGYVYESSGYFEYYDVGGNFLSADELGLETPLIDPLDLIFIFGGLFRVIGKGLLRGGARIAGGAVAKGALRGIAARTVTAMRGMFQMAMAARTLKFTSKTAAHMATKGRYVPVHILKLAIRYGERAPDPQRVAGAYEYTIKMWRGVYKAGESYSYKEYTLKVVLRERDSTVLHFHYE